MRSPRWLPFLAILLIPGTAAAQRYLVHTYTETDGLPSSTVRSLAQDPSGVIWIATRGGIASYDGTHWTRHTVAEGLLEADQAHLSVDADGRIWAVAHLTPVRVAYRENGEWMQVPGPDGAAGERVLGFATVRGAGFDHVLVTLTSGELWCRCLERWNLIPIEGRPSAVLARGDSVFVGTDRGLRVMDLRTGELLGGDLDLPPGGVRGLARDAASGTVWVVGPHWIGRLQDGVFSPEWSGADFRMPEAWGVLAAQCDGTGGLYFGNPVRLLHYRPGADPEPLGLANGLISEGASSLLRDAEDNLWAGGLRGLSKIASFRFATWDTEHGLLDDEVSAIFRRRSGEIVLGHPRGLTFWGDPPERLVVAESRQVERVLGISETADGTLWVAAHLQGLVEIAPDGRLTTHPSPAGPESSVMAVLVDRRDRLWIGTDGGAPLLVREAGVREGGWSPVPLPVQDGVGAYVRRIQEGRDGDVFVATSGAAVFRIGDDGVEHWTVAEPEDPERSAASTYAVLDREDGTVWVGTLGGLFRLDGGELVRETHPRIDRPVYLAFDDRAGDAWFGTDNGIYRWNGSELRPFTVRDGLGGREVNRAAGLAAPDGSVWIGTSRGLSVYRPELDLPRPRGPVVELTSVDVDGRLLPADAAVELTAGAGTLLFQFRAISFVDEEGVRFRTRLEGFDEDWSEPEPLPQRTVRYTNVPPGEYRMHVQAIDVEGAESAVASSGPVVIRPPLLQRPLARAAIAGAALVVALVVAALMAQRRHARRLERVVRERTDELRRTERELARAQRLEALGVLAGGIAHDFNNLLQVMMGGAALLEADTRIPADRRQVAHEVKIAGRHARDLTSQLLTFSKGGAPVRRSTELAGVIRSAAGIALGGGPVRAEIDAEAPLFVDADESQIYQVIHNLLLNARQAMPDGGTVRVRTRPEAGGTVLLEVEDDGPGIPPADLESIFDPFYSTKPGGTGLGLAVAHSIVKRHGGEISAASAPGGGATFRVRLPAGDPAHAGIEAPAAAAIRGSGRVLIMDDDPAVRRSLGRMLSELGYRAWTARNGEEAVSLYREAIARRQGFDAVLMDLRVADGTGGRDAVRALAELDPDVRAIVVSGYSDDPVMASHRDLGFRACLAKPFTPDDLARVLGEATAAPARTAAG